MASSKKNKAGVSHTITIDRKDLESKVRRTLRPSQIHGNRGNESVVNVPLDVYEEMSFYAYAYERAFKDKETIGIERDPCGTFGMVMIGKDAMVDRLKKKIEIYMAQYKVEIELKNAEIVRLKDVVQFEHTEIKGLTTAIQNLRDKVKECRMAARRCLVYGAIIGVILEELIRYFL